MLVSDLRARMSGQEWLEWSVFYLRREQRRELAELAAKNGG
jgi:hypothetical protein